ncbi:2-oxoglutarate dehydrogenase E1 component [Sphingosinicella microcystinivorans]|uniref:2-oxoglutarate dehydrogenase E1 component n=1 Tax=Sphingosinicella microcystinivorans TaxID=335406 RepID=A0AAD1G1C6_SPHMI|nr:2-oxoglutarate dehydrogenase E1 component [Sphingosinicella microcystinivorans]RKS91594.1 2-oxoglutarate dehydrogenase E1 component [Sphingosinicella microcystinivorans]BBE34574.1 2-oxoglutarate dehydrogenase subunit E1 [Sphingosinicella microcystinivorans]
MGFEGQPPSALEGVSASFVESLYRQYSANPASVDPEWQRHFAGLESVASGPSWQRKGWPDTATDDLTAALDPMQMTPELKVPAAKKGGAVAAPSAEAIRQAADDAIRAMTLIRTYRVRGHLAAQLDPLGLAERPFPEELTPEYHGFTGDALNRTVYLGGVMGFEETTITALVAVLKHNYCEHVGVEYMHINDLEERRFIQERIEGRNAEIHFTDAGKKAILNKIIEAEQFESFLGRKYVGTKRFGLDGGEAMAPALESVIKYAGAGGVKEIVIGMAHRGRLNVLANVMQKPFQAIFHEFAGGSSNPDDVGGSGDVKYHLGTSTDRDFDGHPVHLSLTPNPSHLEAVNPVVLGKVRAAQALRGDVERDEVLPLLLHGDAAFAGQGIIAECLGFSGLDGYNTGGTVHFIINNQIGFTTSPQFARSSPYPSDVARTVQAPIFHVNGDDPEAVTFATKVATEFRQKFNRDVVIDMWCYRRFGHNEGDEPGFTQPLMYKVIKGKPKVSEVYAGRLIAEGVIDEAWVEGATKAYVDRLDKDFEAAPGYKPNKADWFEGRWEGLGRPADPETARRAADTGVPMDRLEAVKKVLTTVPEGFSIHPTLKRVVAARGETISAGEGIDWATAEALAFGTLLQDGFGVRLSGQDSGRGTFSQRHAVWVDQKTGGKYVPLQHMDARFKVFDSPLSEFGVLGFEYGYALTDPKTLVLWEAQFGDFANGAQVIIDQFIASGEIKWLRANGLVMLLPHGYEGQGPEHSSARLERYLQLCAEDNMQVCNITTPANYYHVLRRQMLRPFRKPLIIMTPKSLLRHKSAVSRIEEFSGDSHFMRIKSDTNPPADDKIERLVLCSGKVYYDLAEARDAAGDKSTSIVRIEQIYPFPLEALVVRMKRMKKLKTVVWAQEEPKNAGSWGFVRSYLECALKEAGVKTEPVYAGRAAAAATATGLAKRHAAEQKKLVAQALGHDIEG